MTDTSPTHRPVVIVGKCQHCEYDLAGLPAGACPECGGPFDPDDPATLQSRFDLVRATTHIWTALHAVPAAFLFITWIAAFIARAQLGSWPVPNLDDPKSLPMVRWLHDLWAFLAASVVVTTVPCAVTSVCLAIAFARTHRRRYSALICGASAAIWVALIHQWWLDPLDLLRWMAD